MVCFVLLQPAASCLSGDQKWAAPLQNILWLYCLTQPIMISVVLNGTNQSFQTWLSYSVYSTALLPWAKEYVLYGLNSILQNLLRCADDSTNNAKSNNTTLSPSFLEASLSPFPLLILNELTPRPNKSLSHNVCCLFVCCLFPPCNFLLERDWDFLLKKLYWA